MFYSRVQTVILLFGISLVRGFFHVNPFKFQLSASSEYAPLRTQDVPSNSTHWIEQRVDHFNASDLRTWKMKYYKIMKFWKPEGPVLIHLHDNKSPLQPKVDMTPLQDYDRKPPYFVYEIAQETGAAHFILVHRYYGESQPFDIPSIKDLAYLTSRQELADVAHLLRTIKKTPEFQNSKVIVVGCSYAGNLATWMKLLYPELIDAVLASSAPVLAKKDLSECYESVTDTFRTYGSQECVNKITERFDYFHEMFQSPEGIEKLKKEQHICDDCEMDIPENQYYFLSLLMSLFAAYGTIGTPSDVKSFCQDIISSELEQWIGGWCLNIDYNTWLFMLEAMPNIRAGMYQSCTEFGSFRTTSSSKQMFGNSVPADFYYKFCRKLFGEEFNEDRLDQGIINTNRMYGGLTPNVTNVVFVNGDMDPTHMLGIVHDLSADAPAIFLEGAGQCPDFYLREGEYDNVKEARKRIKNVLKKWIGQA